MVINLGLISNHISIGDALGVLCRIVLLYSLHANLFIIGSITNTYIYYVISTFVNYMSTQIKSMQICIPGFYFKISHFSIYNFAMQHIFCQRILCLLLSEREKKIKEKEGDNTGVAKMKVKVK